MRGALKLLSLVLLLPGVSHAIDCSTAGAPRTTAQRATVLPALSPELAAPSYMLGAQGGVLAHAYDESQTVDEVLLRLRIEACRNIASAAPAPTVIDPNDPSVYKAKTEFDNTPWRFDMNQNGKRMTADEFDAWMKSRGVRVARGAAPVAAPAAAAAIEPGAVEAGAVSPSSPPAEAPVVPPTAPPVQPTP